MNFVISKIIGALFAPGTVLMLVLLLAWGWARRRPRASRLLLGVALGFVTLLSVTPIGRWAIDPLQHRFPPAKTLDLDHVDGIILLGGAITNDDLTFTGLPALTSAGERATTFLALARRFPDARLVFSGGGGGIPSPPGVSEADSARILFPAIGLPAERIVFERESRTTWENAQFSKALVQPRPGERWLLLTSAWHMPRAIGCFRASGWPVTAYAVDYLGYSDKPWFGFEAARNLEALTLAVKEWIGLVGYHLQGRTDAWLPSGYQNAISPAATDTTPEKTPMSHAGKLLIDGRWQDGSGPAFASHNPSTGETIWEGASASPADVDAAARSARAAFAAWAERPFAEREKIVRAFATQLEQNKETLADLIGRETGKPRWETRTEVAAMIGKVDISVRAWHARTGVTETAAAGATQALRHRPHGVVAVFGPYNFPGHLPNGHIVPALLAGNAVIFKPSELTPWVAEETAKLWAQAGLPPGVLNLVQGERATGEALAAHAELDGLFFTGSARTGAILARQFAATPQKILALELGGNNPLIVGAIDAKDQRAAIHDVVQSAYLSAGQRCTCARRLFVPAGTAGDAFIEALVTAVRGIKVAAYDAEPQPFMGPLVSPRAADAIIDAQAALIGLGGSAVVEATKLTELGPSYLSPGLIDVTAIAALPDEEHFGPLLQLVRYSDFDHAITLANRTRYGLSAALLSRSKDEYARFYRGIRAGIVNWNRQTTGASSAAPFGGVGASGNHRPSAFYAADYCAFPVASIESPASELPATLAPGLTL